MVFAAKFSSKETQTPISVMGACTFFSMTTGMYTMITG